MRHILASTVLASIAATSAAFGGEHAMDLYGMRDDLIRTRDITGGPVYTTNEADDEGWDDADRWRQVGTDWNNIGEIEDLVLSSDGQLIGIVAEVGGFLDIGDKHVLIGLGDMKLVPVDDRSYSVVTRLSEEQLEALEDVDEGFWD